MVNALEIIHVRNNFQTNLMNDLNTVNVSMKIFMLADKSSKIYKMDSNS